MHLIKREQPLLFVCLSVIQELDCAWDRDQNSKKFLVELNRQLEHGFIRPMRSCKTRKQFPYKLSTLANPLAFSHQLLTYSFPVLCSRYAQTAAQKHLKNSMRATGLVSQIPVKVTRKIPRLWYLLGY